jgi:CRP/FNR family transcriptional regulator, cyclic AMP receptor protein
MKSDNVGRVRSALGQGRRLVRILVEDPDLAHRLEPDEVSEATRQTVGILEEVSPGSWKPASLADGKCLFGGLLLDGLVVRELTVGDVVSAELMGAGDIVLPSDADLAVPFVTAQMTWTALEPTRVAWLDGPFVVAVRRWPQLGAAVLERTRRRIVRVGVLQAIGQMTRIDDRVLTLLWHLAERWGRVRRDGILLPLRLPHKAIGRLIGARRPSVTTAIGSLERQGLIERYADGAWLLVGPAPHALAQLPSVDSPWTDARTGEAAVAAVGREADPPSPPAPPSLKDEVFAQQARAEQAVARARALHDSTEFLAARLRDERENR